MYDIVINEMVLINMKHVSNNIISTDASPQDSASLQKTRIIPNGGGGGGINEPQNR